MEKTSKVFIESAELAELLKKKEAGEDIRILNVTMYATFEEGDPIFDHKKQRIPGSEFLDLRYLRDMSKPYPNMMPSEKHFTDTMKQRQIKASTRVVIYDTKATQTYFATRGYFMFHVMGHQNVSVLNGGLTKWMAEGRAIESDKDLDSFATDFAYKLDSSKIKSYEDILAISADVAAGKSESQILDARPDTAYEAAHISTARCVPQKQLFNADTNCLRPKEEIQALLDSAKINPGQEVITSCNSGMAASYLYAGFKHYNLIPDIHVYDGSWSEYSARQNAAQK